MTSVINSHKFDPTSVHNALEVFLKVAIMILEIKNARVQTLSYSLLIKTLTIWKVDKQEQVDLFVRFYEKSYQKDATNTVSMIQLLQFLISEQIISLFTPTSLKIV